MIKKNSRDLVGYGQKGKKNSWPNNAKLALQFVLNYEEGGENSVLNGDKYSETFLSEIIGAKAIQGRHISMESIYEYGSKVGFWRLNNLFKEKKIPVTIFGVGLALKQNPEVCDAIKNGDYEIAAHGYRWIDYQNIKKSIEKRGTLHKTFFIITSDHAGYGLKKKLPRIESHYNEALQIPFIIYIPNKFIKVPLAIHNNYRFLIFAFFITIYTTGTSLTATYTYRTSSYIWTAAYIFVGYYFLNNKINKNVFFLYLSGVFIVYIFGTGSYPDFLMNISLILYLVQ